jgi:urease accessory protein
MDAGPLLGDAVFAGNRANGRVMLAVTAADCVSRRAKVHEAGSLRVRFPHAERRDVLDAVIVNTAGGMTGGDRFDMEIDVGPGAHLAVTTAAAEKIYRSLGADTEISLRYTVESGGTLAWLPQETILFDRMRLRRSMDIELARDARLVVAEAAIFGRHAMGERLVSGYWCDRRRIRIDGALVFAETIRLDGDIGARLARRAIAGGAVAIASVLKIPATNESIVAVRAQEQNFAGEVGISAWNGIAVARLVAADDAALRHDLVAVLMALDAGPLPRLWVN